ncbi:MAG: GAF domain-containing protein, partial [Chloroflexi bacterium]|nr:GAF domain-containing protein [Chloroflexota bacterium]
MRKTSFLWHILLLFVLESCGTMNPVAIPDAPPSASPADPIPASAATIPSIPYGKNIRFEQISLEEGLSQSVVNVILQDRKGFLWVGTDDGLNRYDGYNFKVFKPDTSDPFSLSDRSITDIVEDKDGKLWIATRMGGLNRYDPVSGKFSQYTHNEKNSQSIISNQITTLFVDENGLWIGTNNGIDFLDFDNYQFVHYSAANTKLKTESKSISVLFKDSAGKLWIGTSNAGLGVYDEVKRSFRSFKNNEYNFYSLSHNRILSITEDHEGQIWIGTGNGLNLYNPEENNFTRFRKSKDDPYSLAGNVVYSLFTDRFGSLWIGTNMGLDRYSPQEGRFIHHQYQPNVPNSLSNNEVMYIYEDDSGVLWLGTYGGGLNKYNRQQDRYAYFRSNPDDPTSLSSNFVFAIQPAEFRRVWVGTLDNGLNLFDPFTETFTRFIHDPNDPNSISNNGIISLFMDKSGALWVGTGSALDRYNRGLKTFTHFLPEDEELNNDDSRFSVFAILEDSHKNFWVGSNRGLYLFDKKAETFSKYGIGFDEIRINTLLEDKDGYLWIGTYDDGLYRLNPETEEVTYFRHDSAKSSTLGSNTVLCIYQDSKGTLWVGTHGGGLSRFNPETKSFTHFTEQEGLSNNVVYGILEDESGKLWLSTNFGLARFDTANQTFRIFTASDGLQSNEFNQNSYAKDRDGTMYFGGINGLNVFVPQEITDNQYTPKVALTSITLDGLPLNKNQERTTEYLDTITLTWPQDSFEFEFAAFAYEQPLNNRYSYKLEGFDTDWINTEKQKNGRYTNLPGGTYTLRLRGSNNDGVWNEQGATIQVIVVPPLWETWWFRGFMIVAFMFSVAGGLRWRVKSVENRNRELERLVKLRTVDLEKRTGEIEALYQADEKILRSITLNQIFQTLVDVSISILKADRSMVLTWSEEKHRIIPRISQGFKPETLSVMRFERDEGLIGIAMKTGHPMVASDDSLFELREDVRKAIESEGIKSFAHFPIVVDEKVMAIFNVAYTRPNALTKDSIRLFTALVNRASMAIANMELFEQTRDLAVMEERNRLARDLHDSAKQKAFAALAQLGTVNGMAKAVAGGPVPLGAAPHLSEAETLVYEVIQELNFLIQEIYPIALQEKGLPTVLREYIFEWENRNDAIINLTIQHERELPLEMEQAVYRVIQEALANVSRHSRAKRVDVSLVYNPDLLQVTMADDGCGFNVNQKATGLGFRSMRERISSVRGT